MNNELDSANRLADTLKLLANIDTGTLNLLQQLQNLQANENKLPVPASHQGQVSPAIALKNVEKIYDESWIVLQNRLLNAITNLDLNERRLVMFLSPIVRKAIDSDPTQRTFIIKVKDYMEEYQIKSNAYYQELKKIGRGLQDKSFVFWNFDKNDKESLEQAVSWIGKSTYRPKLGQIEILLMDDVVQMLTVFDKANPYTKFQREMIVKLGCYGLILFELITSCMFQKFKKKTYTIEFLRQKFNCVDSYEKVSDFKLYVIDKAIKDIEFHTTYKISYETEKQGRAVVGLTFTFEDTAEKKVKNQKKKALSDNTETSGEEKKPSWQVNGLTDKQINKIGIYKQEFIDANSGKVSRTETRGYSAVFEDWRPLLKSPETVNSFDKIQELLDRPKPS